MTTLIMLTFPMIPLNIVQLLLALRKLPLPMPMKNRSAVELGPEACVTDKALWMPRKLPPDLPPTGVPALPRRTRRANLLFRITKFGTMWRKTAPPQKLSPMQLRKPPASTGVPIVLSLTLTRLPAALSSIRGVPVGAVVTRPVVNRMELVMRMTPPSTG